jgi:hypothetical protein
MNRTYYFVAGLTALLLVVLLQAVGIIKQSAAEMPSPSVAASNAVTPAPGPDPVSVAIEDLASWPLAATR